MRMSISQNNVYVHSNPPKAISGSGAAIRQWVKTGDIEKLEKLVLEGQGARLLGLVESSQDAKVKAFLRSIPGYMAKVDLIHDAVIRGSLRETQALIDKKKLATARDAVGRGVGHKAVIYNNKSILEWLAKKHPDIFNLKDNEGRTCLHYAAASRDPDEMYDLLCNLGSNPEIIDMHGRKPNYYIAHPDELDIEGPTTRSLSRGKRRRISPISPPKRKMLVSPPSITRAQIRIWIHEKDIPKLEKIVWSGHGDKLLLETTNNGKVRRFLENVPHLLSRIKSIHGAAINNDLEGLKDMRTKTELKEIFKAKDLHGLTPLHKAAGLGNRGIIEFLMYEIPDALNELDNEGRTPLHYAARDPNVFAFLMKDGADENVIDQKGKSAAYYRLHPLELDTRHLRNVPDAPRVSGELSGWDRASPTLVVGGKRRTSSGEFSTEVTTGKYDLNNVELSAGDLDLHVEEIDFAPAAKVMSRNESRELILDSTDSKSGSNSRILSRAGSKAEVVGSDSKIPSRTASLSEDLRTISRKNSRNDFGEKLNSAGMRGDVQGFPEENMTLEDAFFDSPPNEVFEQAQTEMEPEAMEGETLEEQIPPLDSTEPYEEFEERPLSATENIESSELVDAETQEAEAEPEQLKPDDENEGATITTEEVPDLRPSSAASVVAAGLLGEEADNQPVENSEQAEIEEVDFESELIESEAGTSEVIAEGEATAEGEAIAEGEAVVEEEAIPEGEVEIAEADIPAAIAEIVEMAEKTVENDLEAIENAATDEEFFELEPEPVASSEANMDDNEVIVGSVQEFSDVEAEGVGPSSNDVEETATESEVVIAEEMATKEAEAADEIIAAEEGMDEVEEALKRGDMESLVTKILDGKGAELLNRTTENPDVQEFLSNVPAYMAKIASIHTAASHGNVRDLQSLLDRKRLALARDKLGRGPLHMAVLNNHTTVARHLASAYPQSLKLLDAKGRSALHYAATLPDSGSMYKYLVNLGADPNVKDVEDNTPGIYLRNRDLLTHKELTDESGQGAVETPSPIQRWERPKTPSVSTLATLESFYYTTLMQKESLWTKAWRRLTHQTESSFKALVRKYLDKSTFDLIKVRGMSDGSSLLDVIKFYPQFFMIAPGEEAYDVYQELFVPAIVDHNHILAEFDGKTSVLGEFLVPDFKIPQVDIPSKFVTQVRIRVSRNIQPFPFVPMMKKEDLIKVANLLKTVQLNWPCFDLETIEKDVLEELKQKCWMPEATKISRLWPKQRYFTLSNDGSAQVWMNAEDHLDIIVTSKYGKLYPILETLNDIYMMFSQNFSFYENSQFGFLTVDPFRCGTGMKITFRIRLPTLMRDQDELGRLCSLHNLSIHWKQNRIENDEIEPNDWIELENNTSLGKSELEIALDITNSMNQLIKAEEEKARALILTEKENNKKLN